MEKTPNKHHHRIPKINGVRIVNAEDQKKQQETPQKYAIAETRNIVWLKDNL